MNLTLCILMYASFSAKHPMKTECREHLSKENVAAAEAECRSSGDPLTTCEFVKVSDTSYVIYLRKLEGT